jgi:hypothetical protein
LDGSFTLPIRWLVGTEIWNSRVVETLIDQDLEEHYTEFV